MAIDWDVSPYYDDTNSVGGAIDNNYMRILFRPGYAVQARELTALQSILQNQISEISGFVFASGSPVSGGHLSVDLNCVAVTLQKQYANVDINLSDFLVNGNPTLIFDATSNSSAKAVAMATDSTQANPVLLVKYLTAATFNNGDTIQVATGTQTQASLVTANSSAVGSLVSINDGVFFVGGFFVQVPAQTIVLDSSTNFPTKRVGLEKSEAIINEVVDSNLLDPAQGSFNYQAPGATRYQYSLTLAVRELDSTDDSAFYELMRIENGIITKQIDYPVFADLDKSLAQRTFDTAGDFTVQPFVITTQDNAANTDQYFLVVEPGKAYVKGFEFETIGTQRLTASKARTTNTVKNYGMSLDFGNYVIGQNVHGGSVTGIFDTTNYTQVDLHVVNSANINTASVLGYNLTLCGTARVRDIEFLGLGSYYMYLLDVNMKSNSFIATAGSLNTVTMPSSYVGASQNCYANAVITVNTGGIIDTRVITNFANSSQILTLNQNLSIVAGSGSNCIISFAVGDVGCAVMSPNTASLPNLTSNAGWAMFATKTAANGYYSCFDIGPGGMSSTGNTVLSDTGLNTLVYPLPQNYIAPSSITNTSFTVRKAILNQTFGATGNLTISGGSGLGTGESFAYGFTGYLPDIAANNNLLVIVRNKLSSNFSNGQILNFDYGTYGASGNGVYETDNTHLTIVSSSNTGGQPFVADIFVTVAIAGATSHSVARRDKNLVGNASNSFLLSTDSISNATKVISGSLTANTVYIDTSNGYVWFTNNVAMAMSPGAKQNLYVADVFNVIKIIDSGNTNWAPSNANSATTDTDISTNYYLDSGQRDNYYDFASLELKPGANPPKGQTVVMIQYFQPDLVGAPVLGFFDADSYSSTIYSNGQIPYYSSQAQGTVSLRDSIDFRPVRTIGTAANVDAFTLNGVMCPYPDAPMVTDFGYYLPRVDKLMLSKDKTFLINQGTPAQYPVSPTDSDDAMTLYIITLPAYTGNVSQIQMQYIEHKRYTMRDIGVLDTRIQALELQSTLSTLEQQAVQEKITYSDGVTTKDQYGILADDFGSLSIADNQNIDLRAYLAQNSLTPYKDQHTFSLNFVANTGPYSQDGKCYCLSFTETAAIVSNQATTYISVQPYLFATFAGHAKLVPETVSKFSANITPVIIAPPSSPPPDLPPVPPPAAAPVLAVGAPVQQAPVVVSSRIEYFEFPDWWDVWDFRSGNRFYTRIWRRGIGYGLINPFYNWYGIPREITAQAPAKSIPPNSGSSIQLAAGTAKATAVAAVASTGAIHLFGGGGK